MTAATKTTAEEVNGSAISMLPAEEVYRKPPVNLSEADLPIFEHELTRIIPPVELLELRDVRISSEGLLLKRGRILDQSFTFPFLRNELKKRSVVKLLFRTYLSRKTRKLDQAAVWITDQWSAGYFHWLSDALPRLVLVRNQLRNKTLLLPSGFERLDYVLASLKAFNVQDVEFIGEDEGVQCKRLLLPTPVAPSGHFREEIIQQVRQQLLDYFGTSESETRRDRVYISRRRATKRRIVNEDEVRAVLSASGFKIIHAEDLSFAEQVSLFSQTRYLISNHGAGLTNMLFLRPEGSVLELRHETDRVNNCYFTLSSALDHSYFYQTCAGENDQEDPHTVNLVVDVYRLNQNLQLMLEN